MKAWFDTDGKLISLTSENVEGVAIGALALVGIPGLSDDLPLGRTFYVDGNIVVYPDMTVTAPTVARVNDVVVVVASLPADTPDTEVSFALDGGTPVKEPVVQGKAVHAYVFVTAGTYRIAASSAHHGTAIVEVVVR